MTKTETHCRDEATQGMVPLFPEMHQQQPARKAGRPKHYTSSQEKAIDCHTLEIVLIKYGKPIMRIECTERRSKLEGLRMAEEMIRTNIADENHTKYHYHERKPKRKPAARELSVA